MKITNEKNGLTGLIAAIENPNEIYSKSIRRATVFLIIGILMVTYLSLNSSAHFSSNLLWMISGGWIVASVIEFYSAIGTKLVLPYIDRVKIESRLLEIGGDRAVKYKPSKFVDIVVLIVGAAIVYGVLYVIDHGLPM